MHTEDIMNTSKDSEINNLKEEITRLRRRIAVLERVNNVDRTIPDDVKDIPLTLTAADYKPVTDGVSDISEVWYVDRSLNSQRMGISSNYIDSGMWDDAKNHTMYPNKEFAEMYREKCQLIADMLHFKWLYDREYVPDWNNESKQKYFVYLDIEKGFTEYLCDYTYSWDRNSVYFSTDQIAGKCAEWLDYLYKKGKYTECI